MEVAGEGHFEAMAVRDEHTFVGFTSGEPGLVSQDTMSLLEDEVLWRHERV